MDQSTVRERTVLPKSSELKKFYQSLDQLVLRMRDMQIPFKSSACKFR